MKTQLYNIGSNPMTLIASKGLAIIKIKPDSNALVTGGFVILDNNGDKVTCQENPSGKFALYFHDSGRMFFCVKAKEIKEEFFDIRI